MDKREGRIRIVKNSIRKEKKTKKVKGPVVAKKEGRFADFRRGMGKSKALWLMFLLPAVWYFIFCYIPMYGLSISFLDYNVVKGFRGSEWVGFEYFKKIFSDPVFWQSLKNTVVLSGLDILCSFPAPIILALLLNEVRKGLFKNTVQSISFFPNFVSTVVLCGMVVNFLVTDGLLNQILAMIIPNYEPQQFLTNPDYFRAIYIISGIWKNTGWESLVYIAALTAIDPQLYEAAKIDGAGRFKQIIHITLPGIFPTIAIMFILAIGRIVSVSFEKILLLYTGSTRVVADVIQTYVYRLGVLGADFSYSTAVGLFQSVVAFALVYLANYLTKRLSGSGLW